MSVIALMFQDALDNLGISSEAAFREMKTLWRSAGLPPEDFDKYPSIPDAIMILEAKLRARNRFLGLPEDSGFDTALNLRKQAGRLGGRPKMIPIQGQLLKAARGDRPLKEMQALTRLSKGTYQTAEGGLATKQTIDKIVAAGVLTRAALLKTPSKK
jgi:hypothetical protein